jgi:UDP-N-acetylmuramyl pentapeptide phosphotransferase/UDP-N-acetylglucosamine-1-phosphate transferase
MIHFSLVIIGFAAGAAALTWALVALLIRHAPRIGLVDRPNERSLHTRVTPRGGGIGFVVALAIGLAGWAIFFAAGDRPKAEGRMMDAEVGKAEVGKVEGPILSADVATRPQEFSIENRQSEIGNAGMLPFALSIVLGASLFIAAISLRDDFKSLGAGLRFACHFAAAGAAIWALGPFTVFALPFIGEVEFGVVVGTVLTMLWIVGLTNVYNFMDGIDGIAGIQGVVAGLAWLVAGLALQAPTTAVLGALLAGGCAGFLVHNWSPAKIFMGDVGSAFLGFLFAVVPLVVVCEAPEVAARWPLFAALAVFPFLGDGILTFLRRARKREKVWLAHRSHLYQRLVQTGWRHASVSELYGAWGLMSVIVAWRWLPATPGSAVAVLVMPVVTLAGLYSFVTKRERAPGTCGAKAEGRRRNG